MITKRQSRILMGAFAWTTYVWISRLVIMSGQDESAGFKIVHGVLAVISIAFGVAVGKIGWENRQTASRTKDEPGELARRA